MNEQTSAFRLVASTTASTAKVLPIAHAMMAMNCIETDFHVAISMSVSKTMETARIFALISLDRTTVHAKLDLCWATTI